ncbi:MAG: phage antirepressor KilAC domain-containing protein [Xenococcaceae cyanobacterium]
MNNLISLNQENNDRYLYSVDRETGYDVVIDTQTGESFTTISGYARMGGVSTQAISKRYASTFDHPYEAQVFIRGMFREVNLVPEKTIIDWLGNDNVDALVQVARLGARFFNYKIAGYKQPEAFDLPQTKGEALMLAAKQQIEIEAKDRLLAEAKPAVDFYSAIVESPDSIKLTDFGRQKVCQDIGLGANKITEELRAMGILQKTKRQPYSTYAHWFEIVSKPRAMGIAIDEVLFIKAEALPKITAMLKDRFDRGELLFQTTAYKKKQARELKKKTKAA